MAGFAKRIRKLSALVLTAVMAFASPLSVLASEEISFSEDFADFVPAEAAEADDVEEQEELSGNTVAESSEEADPASGTEGTVKLLDRPGTSDQLPTPQNVEASVTEDGFIIVSFDDNEAYRDALCVSLRYRFDYYGKIRKTYRTFLRRTWEISDDRVAVTLGERGLLFFHEVPSFTFEVAVRGSDVSGMSEYSEAVSLNIDYPEDVEQLPVITDPQVSDGVLTFTSIPGAWEYHYWISEENGSREVVDGSFLAEDSEKQRSPLVNQKLIEAFITDGYDLSENYSLKVRAIPNRFQAKAGDWSEKSNVFSFCDEGSTLIAYMETGGEDSRFFTEEAAIGEDYTVKNIFETERPIHYEVVDPYSQEVIVFYRVGDVIESIEGPVVLQVCYEDTCGWQQEGGKWCYLDSYGMLVYNQWKLKEFDDGRVRCCYLGDDGYMVYDVFVEHYDGNIYYVGPDGGRLEDCWLTIAGPEKIKEVAERYYWLEEYKDASELKFRFDENGRMLRECEKTIEGVKYSFDENGVVSTQEPIVFEYTITYELNGGKNSSKNPATYTVTTADFTLSKPTKTGYTFAGWYSDSAFKTKVTTIKKGTTGNRTFYAKWTQNKYSIAFNANGGTGTMSKISSVSYSTKKTLPANTFKKTGYTFTGWNRKADGSSTAYADKASVSKLSSTNGATVTLYAQWKKNTYKITYELNGGKNSSKNPATYTVTTADFTLSKPTRTGYTFAGWYSDSAFKTKVTTIKKGTTGNKTFYAKWTVNKYSIAFNKNGGTGSMKSLTGISYSTTKTLTANAFKRTGYKFAGWNTKADGSGTAYKDKASVSKLSSKDGATVTLYAQWSKIKYTITYELNGGTNNKNNPATYTVTTKDITLAKPTKKGYTFGGWYKESTFKTKITKISKGSTGNKTFYAKWKKNTYSITYNLNGGKNNSKNPATYTVTTSDITLEKPTRKGYTFGGWYSDSKYKTKITSIKKGSTGSKTVYAKWVLTKYQLFYHLDGGKNSKHNPDTYTIATSISLQKPTKKGYTFKGWYCDKDYTKPITVIPKGSTGNKDLFARWTGNKYSIVFEANGGSGTMSKFEGLVYGKTYRLPENKFSSKYLKFDSWNTSADGSGKTYRNKEEVTSLLSENGGTVHLYAQWKSKIQPDFSMHFSYEKERGFAAITGKAYYDLVYDSEKRYFNSSGVELYMKAPGKDYERVDYQTFPSLAPAPNRLIFEDIELGKTYSFKCRGYSMINGRMYYGEFSSPQKVETFDPYSLGADVTYDSKTGKYNLTLTNRSGKDITINKNGISFYPYGLHPSGGEVTEVTDSFGKTFSSIIIASGKQTTIQIRPLLQKTPPSQETLFYLSFVRNNVSYNSVRIYYYKGLTSFNNG